MKSERGQALVELAIVLPLFLLLVFGITDFGRIFFVHLTLDHAGREGARIGIIGRDDADIESVIRQKAQGIDQSKLEISITPEGISNRGNGDDLTITLTYPVDFLTPIIGQIIPPFELNNVTIMRVE